MSEAERPVVYIPSEGGTFAEVSDRRQRRALALIQQFGVPGGGEKVCFVGDMIVVASPCGPLAGDEIDLCVCHLAEFIRGVSADAERNGDGDALRQVEMIATMKG